MKNTETTVTSALRHLLDFELEAKGWEYYMEVSFVEIYNEDIRDLLRSGQHEPGRHEIKKDAQGKLYISDVTLIAVDPNDVAHVEK
jgi:kinesin family protein C1